MKRIAKFGSKTNFLLLVAFLCLLLSGCDQVGEILASPTPLSFPTMTPLATFTPKPSLTPLPSHTVTPTQITPVIQDTPIHQPEDIISPDNASDIQLLAQRGYGIPTGILYSPNGKWLAVISTRGLRLLQTDSLQEIDHLELNSTQTSLSFSPSSRFLAIGSQDGSIRILSLTTGGKIEEILSTEQPSRLPIESLSFSPDSSILATSSRDRSIRLWTVSESGIRFLRSHKARFNIIKQVSFSADGELLYAWTPKENVQVWKTSNGQAREEIYIGNDDRGTSAINGFFSQDFRFFAVNHGRRMRIFLTRNGTTKNLLKEEEPAVSTLVLSPQGTYLGAIKPGLLSIWELESGEIIQEIPLENFISDQYHFAFSPDESHFVLLSNQIEVWQIGKDISQKSTNNSAYSTDFLLFSQPLSGKEMISVFQDQQFQKSQINDGTLIQNENLSDNVIISFAAAPDQDKFAAGQWLSPIQILETDNLEEIKRLENPYDSVRSLAFSKDGELLAAGYDDDNVIIWQLKENQKRNTFEHEDTPQQIFFSSENEQLIVRTSGQVFIWEIETQSRLHIFSGYNAAYSAEMNLLAIASLEIGEWFVHLRNTDNGKIEISLPTRGKQMAFSPDGKILAIADQDLTIWDTQEGIKLITLNTGGLIGRLQFTPDGKYLLLITGDGVTRIWGTH
ncbi:MAG: PD40 domain-containing protein [Anaerolineaceae bacterium]|nr:PD40 domain-containing protein [Anaerolineaceae bacterium]